MDSISSGPIADILAALHRKADEADRPLMERFLAEDPKADRQNPRTETEIMTDAINKTIEHETKDLTGFYSGMASNFLSVSPQFGRFLYACVRATQAKRIVEFGTSMGVSTIYLAAGVRDNNNNGVVIGSELEPTKAERARANLDAAGLGSLVEIRVGDARETLARDPHDGDRDIDMVLLDGAFTLYLDVLKVLEPRLRLGALVIGENSFQQAGGYVDYVSDPRNGYLTVPLAFEQVGRGNLLSVRTN